MGSVGSSLSCESGNVCKLSDVSCPRSILVLGLNSVGKQTLLLRPAIKYPALLSDEVPPLQASMDPSRRVAKITVGSPSDWIASFWQDIFTVSEQQRTANLVELKTWVNRTVDAFSHQVRTAQHTFRVRSWSVEGMNKIRPLWRHFYQGGRAIVYIVDVSGEEKTEMDREQLNYYLSEEELIRVPLLVLLNKVDVLEDQSPEGIEEMKQRWLRILQIEETVPYDCSELVSVMEESYLAERSNRELIQSLSNEIHSLLFGHSSVSVKSMLTHPNPSLRRPIRVQPCSVLKDWDSVKDGLEWLFKMIKELSQHPESTSV